MPIFPQPVLADLEAIIQAIIFLVILASGAVRMFRESKDVQRRAERRQQRPDQPPRPDQQRGGQVAEARAAEQRQPPQQDIRSEVEEFLRRVGEGTEDGRQEPKRPRPERRPRVEVIEDDTGFEVDERPRQTRQRPPRPKPRPAPVEAAAAATVAERIEHAESVAEHVTGHMSRDEFAARAAHLGAELSQTDERLEARLHQKFDHGLGNLSARRLAREAADLEQRGLDTAPTLADNLLTLLSTPQGVQQAIILSEVLDRPTDRW